MGNVTVQSRVKPELKEKAKNVFSAIGLSTADAIRMFLQQSVNVGGLPFRPTAKQPNVETIEALEELAQGKGKKFQSTKAFYKDLGI